MFISPQQYLLIELRTDEYGKPSKYFIAETDYRRTFTIEEVIDAILDHSYDTLPDGGRLVPCRILRLTPGEGKCEDVTDELARRYVDDNGLFLDDLQVLQWPWLDGVESGLLDRDEAQARAEKEFRSKRYP